MMQPAPELLPALRHFFDLELPESFSLDELRNHLAAHINRLIDQDFEKLVFLLYRIDVDEARMRALLQHREGTDSGLLIADLIIERQLQKIQSRRSSGHAPGVPEEEKW